MEKNRKLVLTINKLNYCYAQQDFLLGIEKLMKVVFIIN